MVHILIYGLIHPFVVLSLRHPNILGLVRRSMVNGSMVNLQKTGDVILLNQPDRVVLLLSLRTNAYLFYFLIRHLILTSLVHHLLQHILVLKFGQGRFRSDLLISRIGLKFLS